jgi:hypothetical protein
MSVLSMVTDPEFQKLQASDQQAALSGIDPAFGNLNASDFNATVTGLQKKALTRPDLAAPSAVAKPTTDMQTSALGTIYGKTVAGPTAGAAPLSNPKLAGAQQLAADLPNSQSQEVASGVETGAIKGAAETAHTAGRIANAVTGDSVSSLPTSFKEPDYLQANGTAENVGKVGENILEFITGDEALKGLAMSEKLGLATKLSKLAESSQHAARIIDLGLNAARQGAVGSLQTLAHGGTATDALETGATVGVTGAGLGLIDGVRPANTR